MTLVTISDKGQTTLPAPMRKRLGIKSRSKVEVVTRDSEIVIRPAKTIRDVAGIFAEHATRTGRRFATRLSKPWPKKWRVNAVQDDKIYVFCEPVTLAEIDRGC